MAYESLYSAWEGGARDLQVLLDLTRLLMRGHGGDGQGGALARSSSLFEEALCGPELTVSEAEGVGFRNEP